MKNRILQAYKQAPWRVQLQWIGLFLLALVLAAAITAVYLNVSAQAATAGRMVQFKERDIDEINNEIAELTADVAAAHSTENLKQRAEAMGFSLMNSTEAVYLEIPGYNPNPDLVLAPPRANIISESPMIRSSYKSSLWDWFIDQIWKTPGTASQSEGEVSP